MSASPAVGPIETTAPIQHSAIVSDAKAAKKVATHTTLKAVAGYLGQGSFFLIKVSNKASAGMPTGTVTLMYHGGTVATLTLTPTTSKNKHVDVAEAAYTIAPGGGDHPYYYGFHRFGAVYAGAGNLAGSKGFGSIFVKVPRKTFTADHLRVATIIDGTGTATLSIGKTANMAYTGFLWDTGAVFDNSEAHGGFTYLEKASPEQVIKGFDEGADGMKVGETRVLVIPSAIGYGAMGSGTSIPPNAKLVFLITLIGIS
jgi:hypothetical protein